MEQQRRSSDTQISKLVAKVEELDADVQKLKKDFNEHATNEAMKIELLNATLVSIQVKLDQLLLEIKEPMEAYKTTKYGMHFLKYLADTAKWLVPLVTALILGYSALDVIKEKPTEKPAITQQVK